jgi:hypothetical protein
MVEIRLGFASSNRDISSTIIPKLDENVRDCLLIV